MSIQLDGYRRSTEIATFAHVLSKFFHIRVELDIEQRARSAWGTSRIRWKPTSVLFGFGWAPRTSLRAGQIASNVNLISPQERNRRALVTMLVLLSLSTW